MPNNTYIRERLTAGTDRQRGVKLKTVTNLKMNKLKIDNGFIKSIVT